MLGAGVVVWARADEAARNKRLIRAASCLMRVSPFAGPQISHLQRLAWLTTGERRSRTRCSCQAQSFPPALIAASARALSNGGDKSQPDGAQCGQRLFASFDIRCGRPPEAGSPHNTACHSTDRADSVGAHSAKLSAQGHHSPRQLPLSHLRGAMLLHCCAREGLMDDYRTLVNSMR